MKKKKNRWPFIFLFFLAFNCGHICGQRVEVDDDERNSSGKWTEMVVKNSFKSLKLSVNEMLRRGMAQKSEYSSILFVGGRYLAMSTFGITLMFCVLSNGSCM